MRLRPYGDAAVLVEVDDLDAVHALYAVLREDVPAGVTDVVPAARTVLVRLDPARTTPAAVAGWLRAARPTPVRRADAAEVRIPVVYDGPDLAAVAAAVGWSTDRLVAAHHGQAWRVGFVGFAPGFAYLGATQEWPEVPRLAEPRTDVPAGAVAVAGPYSGVYPRRSPGGWSIVGRTGLSLWEITRDPPALLRPGGTVRFVVAT